MKIGVRAHDLGSSKVDEIIEICNKNGIDGLQLVVKKTFPDQFMNDQFLKEQIVTLRSAGVDIFLLGSYFNMIHPEVDKLDEGIKTFKRNVQIAKDNNIPVVGSETGSVNGDEWTYNSLNHTATSRIKLSQTIERIMENLGSVNYLLEPVFDHVVYDYNITAEMIELHDMSLTFDLVNILNIENYLQYEQLFEIYLQMFGNRIRLFHFKNFNIIDDQKVGCELNEGVVDYGKIIPLVNKYNLASVPVIVEELEGQQLFNSISYLKKLDSTINKGEL